MIAEYPKLRIYLNRLKGKKVRLNEDNLKEYWGIGRKDVRIIAKKLLTLGFFRNEAEEEVICRGIRALDVKYYDGYDWLDSWDSATQDNGLPLAVEVSITLAGTENTSILKSQTGAAGITMKKTILLSCAETRQ